MKEARFRDNVIWMGFFLTLLVVYAHALNAELFLGEAGTAGPVGIVEQMLGSNLAQIAVPGFFLISAVLFFRDFKPSKLKGKWLRRVRSVLIPYLLWNLIYYLFYFVGSRIPGLTDMINHGKVPGGLKAIADAVFFYRYNYVYWYLFQLILLILLSPLIYEIVRHRIAFPVVLGITAIFILFRIDRTPLNSDALFYYMVGAKAARLFRPRKKKPRRAGSITLVDNEDWYVRRFSLPQFISAAMLNAVGLILYSLFLLSGNDLPLVLSRLSAAVAVWYLVCCLPLPKPMMAAKLHFLLYTIHFPIVRLLNKAANLFLHGSAAAALILFFVMPFLMLGVTVLAANICRRYIPGIFSVLMGERIQ